MNDNGKEQPDDEEAYLQKHEQEEIKRERSVQGRGCLIVLVVVGVLGFIILFLVLGR